VFAVGIVDLSVIDKNNFLDLNNIKEKQSFLNNNENLDAFLFPLNIQSDDYKNFFEEIEKKYKKSFVYIVKKGESLYQISKKFDVSLKDLLSYNGLSEKSIIKEGDKIYIPGIKPQAIIEKGQIAKRKNKVEFVVALKDIDNFVIPVSGLNWKEKHGVNGTDIASPCGSEVYASQDGIVIESSDGWNGGYGNYIIIQHKNNVLTVYGHLSLRLVEKGDEVKKGQLIGYVGNTGYTIGPTGCHLHFELRGGLNPLLK
jgi:murein DD-endopeptidase MepM/ murein hydrolase activator NlpD